MLAGQDTEHTALTLALALVLEREGGAPLLSDAQRAAITARLDGLREELRGVASTRRAHAEERRYR